ncbi:MAG: efflux RND transporter permease subunit [Pseudobdellovibrionaceae bacterium]|jgi:multidrug efflux pump subunit AcrB|nr:efflux RND transporter permease subunit [Pseudobdellovibrionaceae bacterium]
MSLGISGFLTRLTITSPLTPLILLTSIMLGAMALVSIPREEEPQISVPMIDIMVQANGLKAPDAVELVTKPLEAIVKSVEAVEHVYSQTHDDKVMVTARFDVGTNSDDAILRVHEKIRANYDQMPVGIPEPLIVGRGINDVAIVTLTLSAKGNAAERWTDATLLDVAEKLRREIVKINDIGLTYISGGNREEIRVEPDPEMLATYGVTLQQLAAKISQANRSFDAGYVINDGENKSVKAGQTLKPVPDIGQLLLTTRDGRPVYVGDVARILVSPRPATSRVTTLNAADGMTQKPAVTLAVAKRAGANAVVISEDILAKIENLKGTIIPSDLDIEVTRNYGQTANEKANELLFHLGLATLSIVLLIGWSIGKIEGAVTFFVIPTTIMLTLFASWLMGYTINRVSLFALIFSIGILVDDAVVMVENISRHWAMRDGRSKIQATIDAVSEVGNPTVLATLTVVVALLPMLFVGGLMGPYMAPIPVNASIAMLISFVIAVTIAPWLMFVFSNRFPKFAHHEEDGHDGKDSTIARIYTRMVSPIITTPEKAKKFLLIVGFMTIASMILFVTKTVVVKLLPFDNKSELSLVVDLREGAPLEDTERVLLQLAYEISETPEIISIQAYAGTAAPFNFNGLVRHYFARSFPEQGELQINLAAKHDRDRTSHEIALAIRKTLEKFTPPAGTSIKLVEVPPGPPVMSTLLAEIYGPDAQSRRTAMAKVADAFNAVPFVVDVDTSVDLRRPDLRLSIDQDKLEFFGVEQQDVYDTISYLMNGTTVGYSHRGEERNPLPITLRLPKTDLSWSEYLATVPVPANQIPGNKAVVELGDVIEANDELGGFPIYRRDGHFAEMVQAELAGTYEAPIYGMFAVEDQISKIDWGTLGKPTVKYHGQPDNETGITLLWDGEWEVTYVTFRDMGIAFMVALLGIYVLVVAQFRSYTIPLVILTPVPLTLIGIILGHWLFGAAFTATSMIGFIALAGIIVRNSILLVDFIQERRRHNLPLRDVLVEAGSIRARPILLTALAAMIGAAVILADPIFQGLAISLLFGLVSSTLLTLLVIPAIYIVMRDDKHDRSE